MLDLPEDEPVVWRQGGRYNISYKMVGHRNDGMYVFMYVCVHVCVYVYVCVCMWCGVKGADIIFRMKWLGIEMTVCMCFCIYV